MLHPGRLDWPTVAIGVATLLLIVVLERTPLRSLGMVVAIVLTSGVAALLNLDTVAALNDIADIPGALPRPVLPDLRLFPELLIPALSLAFVGLVQGAGISAKFPNPDGSQPDSSRDFAGQGVANLACGVFQGMPVGGSMSASSLVKEAGAKSRQALVITGVVMAVVILLFGDAVGYIAMPAMAALLILIGIRTVKPHDLTLVARTGPVSAVVMGTTFVLTLFMPIQYAVLAGVGLSVLLYVVMQSNRITIRLRVFDDDEGHVHEVDPPPEVPANEVVVLQPYGSLFFASAPVFHDSLPAVTPSSRNSVVILRLRGRSDLGTTFMGVLLRYASELAAVGSKLVIVSVDDQLLNQLRITKVEATVGPENIYPATDRVGSSLRRARADALAWVASHRHDG